MRIHVDISGIIGRVESMKPVILQAVGEQALTDAQNYVLYRDGNLYASGETCSRPEQGHLEWRTPYAHRRYFESVRHITKSRNPNARIRWAEEAKRDHLQDWIEAGQKVIK